MSLKSDTRRVNRYIEAATPEKRERYKWLIKYHVRGWIWTLDEFPIEMLGDLSSGLFKFLVKVKAGFNLPAMLHTIRTEGPALVDLVVELQEEFLHGKGRNGPRLELGSGDPAIADQGRGLGPGPPTPAALPAIGAGDTTAGGAAPAAIAAARRR